MEMEWLEDDVREEGRPPHSLETAAVHRIAPQNESGGVRALAVAMKRGNACGAKGRRKVGCGKSREVRNDRRASVPPERG